MKYITPLLILAATMLSACADDPALREVSPSLASDQQLRPLGGLGAPPSDLDERMLALGQAYFKVDRVLKTADSWENADRQLSALSEMGTPLDQWAVEQTAASDMLSTFFVDGPVDSAAARAALRYTRHAVEGGSPDAPLVAAVVQRYQSQWEPHVVQDIAERAAALGRERIAKLSDCGENCGPTSQDPVEARHMAGQQAVSLSQTTDAVRELEVIAESRR